MSIDRNALSPGAKVTIEGTVGYRTSDGLVRVDIGTGYEFFGEEDYPAILSVTHPPTDWSKVIDKRITSKKTGLVGKLLAFSGSIGFVHFDCDEAAITWLLSDLTPLPDETSAGEADDVRVEEFNAMHQPKPDTRPAWQRAKVGDVVQQAGFVEPGMSLRDWFAGQALAGYCGNPSWTDLPTSKIANAVYAQADAMLAERAKEHPTHD